jgi:hypothetical protein
MKDKDWWHWAEWDDTNAGGFSHPPIRQGSFPPDVPKYTPEEKISWWRKMWRIFRPVQVQDYIGDIDQDLMKYLKSKRRE